MGAQKKWKKFEELAASIQKSLSPNAEVSLHKKIKGKNSNQIREIDIAVTRKYWDGVNLIT